MNGATIAVIRLLEPLRGLGWDISLWAPVPGPAFDWLSERGFEVAGLPRPIASGLQALREPPGVRRRIEATPGYLTGFAKRMREVRPDVVHANSLYSFAEALTSKAMGVPTVMHLHDMAPSSWKAEPVRQMTRRALDRAVAVSEACASSYATGQWAPDVVHGAAPLPDDSCEIRASPDPFTVGTVGVISKRKGSDLFVEAAERLQRSHPEIELHMIGSPTDPLDREWGERVLKRARAAGVRHISRGDVAKKMSEWDAFVLPSRRDPFPLVTLEAMAAGLPVIGSRADGIPEQLGADGGVLVDSEDTTALVNAIARMAALPAAERRRMGQAARARVERLFTIGRQAEGMDDQYRRVLAG